MSTWSSIKSRRLLKADNFTIEMKFNLYYINSVLYKSKRTKLKSLKVTITLIAAFLFQPTYSQIEIEAGAPTINTDIPGFFKSKLSDINLK